MTATSTRRGPKRRHDNKNAADGALSGVLRARTVLIDNDANILRVSDAKPWRDLPRERFGPWQTVWKRHRRFTADGTWDKILSTVQAQADAAGQVDWTVAVDSTVNRAHQRATNTRRGDADTGARPNHKNPPTDPADHSVGRSRGGLSTKIHHLVDGRGWPLVVIVGPGQGHDGQMPRDRARRGSAGGRL